MKRAVVPSPCPFCGETLVRHRDEDLEWWAHRDDAPDCAADCIDLYDDLDVADWNKRVRGRVSRADVEAFTAALIRAWPEPFRGGHPGYTAITAAVQAGMAAIGLELETE